jgi:hypothetical protein
MYQTSTEETRAMTIAGDMNCEPMVLIFRGRELTFKVTKRDDNHIEGAPVRWGRVYWKDEDLTNLLLVGEVKVCRGKRTVSWSACVVPDKSASISASDQEELSMTLIAEDVQSALNRRSRARDNPQDALDALGRQVDMLQSLVRTMP